MYTKAINKHENLNLIKEHELNVKQIKRKNGSICRLHSLIWEIENKKSKKGYCAPNFIQRASHGLQSYYVFWIDENVSSKGNKLTVQDLVEAGFKIRPYKSISEA